MYMLTALHVTAVVHWCQSILETAVEIKLVFFFLKKLNFMFCYVGMIEMLSMFIDGRNNLQ